MNQREAWNGPSGQAWIESQELLDHVLQPYADVLLETDLGARVLDVGCGTGATTIQAARAATGRTALGVDISEPMIEVARRRGAGLPVSFVAADAATHGFELPRYETIISRFGVMFFDEPVRAFANLRRAGERLRVIAWRGPEENDFMTLAERTAGPLLPPLPARVANGPGQFAFGDPKYVTGILAASGWRNARLEPIDRICTMPADALLGYTTRLGPVGRLFQQADEATRGRVETRLREAFAKFVSGAEARFETACWLVTAE